jgi:hypothetical protein
MSSGAPTINDAVTGTDSRITRLTTLRKSVSTLTDGQKRTIDRYLKQLEDIKPDLERLATDKDADPLQVAIAALTFDDQVASPIDSFCALTEPVGYDALSKKET